MNSPPLKNMLQNFLNQFARTFRIGKDPCDKSNQCFNPLSVCSVVRHSKYHMNTVLCSTKERSIISRKKIE